MKAVISIIGMLAVVAVVASPQLPHGVASAAEPAPVRLVVLLEGAAGGGPRAQGYLDQLVALSAKRNGWSDAGSKYTTSRSKALKYIAAETPTFGILSLGAYLALQDAQQLTVIGQVHASSVGGLRYFVVSKAHAALADCKGETLASHHLDDPLFIDRVVFGGKSALKDFEAVDTKRPVKTLKSVIRGEAACALIDDAQLETLKHLEGGGTVKAIWESAELPPTPVVAFPAAKPALTTRFQASFAGLCSDEGAAICSNVGIDALKVSAADAYAGVLSAYSGRQ